jgi:AGZA family xanthine/uracil permease-like MFS transporter
MLERLFHLREHNTTIGREIIGGVVTFMALSYIVFVQPVVMSAAGIDHAGAFFATCVASALACFLMGLWANYPIALAPAMGHNFLFTFTIVLAMGFSWQEALAANFISGATFLALGFFGLREAVMQAVPDCLKYGIAVGIGLLIAFLGLQWGGIVENHAVLYVQLAKLKDSPIALLTLFGLALISILLVLRIRAAILIGMLATTGVALLVGRWWPDLPVRLVQYGGDLVAAPPSPARSAFKLDFAGVFAHPVADWIAVIFILLILDLFDTVGTLLGVSERAGLLRDGKLPRAKRALSSDAVGTCVGTLLGTSTVTSYVESSAGVSSGARTGLAAVTTGVLLLGCLFFYPVVEMIGGGAEVTLPEFQGGGVARIETVRFTDHGPQTASVDTDGQTVTLFRKDRRYPVIAPALIIVGVFMMASVAKIKWSDYSEAIPAFLTIVIMQMAFSVTDGIAWGFVSYTLLKAVAPGERRIHPLVALFAALFVARYIWLAV